MKMQLVDNWSAHAPKILKSREAVQNQYGGNVGGRIIDMILMTTYVDDMVVESEDGVLNGIFKEQYSDIITGMRAFSSVIFDGIMIVSVNDNGEAVKPYVVDISEIDKVFFMVTPYGKKLAKVVTKMITVGATIIQPMTYIIKNHITTEQYDALIADKANQNAMPALAFTHGAIFESVYGSPFFAPSVVDAVNGINKIISLHSDRAIKVGTMLCDVSMQHPDATQTSENGDVSKVIDMIREDLRKSFRNDELGLVVAAHGDDIKMNIVSPNQSAEAFTSAIDMNLQHIAMSTMVPPQWLGVVGNVNYSISQVYEKMTYSHAKTLQQLMKKIAVTIFNYIRDFHAKKNPNLKNATINIYLPPVDIESYAITFKDIMQPLATAVSMNMMTKADAIKILNNSQLLRTLKYKIDIDAVLGEYISGK